MEKKSFPDFHQSRIAVTGGMGFIGSAIARRLLKEGVREVVLLGPRDRLPPLLEEWKDSGRLVIMKGDIRNPQEVSRALEGCDAVFHQAALRVTQAACEPRLAHEIMVDGTFNVVSACVDLGVKKIVAASSATLYGEAESLPISETHPLHDTSIYSIFKVQNEMLLRSFWENFGLRYTILRYFNVYGPGMNLYGEEVEVLIRWLDRLDAGLAPIIFGEGTQTLDWVFIDDVAEANLRALCFPHSGEVFNVCSGQGISLVDLLQVLCKILGVKAAPELQPARAINNVEKRCGDPRKAADLLGFRARTGLEDGLGRLTAWRASLIAGGKVTFKGKT